MADSAEMQTAMKLSDATLSQLPEQVDRPKYDRSALTPGIVHIGLGNFHRAHQAWYLHRLMQDGLARDWAIIGAGVRAGDNDMRNRLLLQDCMTTLIELDPKGTSAEVIGPMIDFLPVEEDNAALIRAMSDPSIRIVSLTVTEGGYFIDAKTGLLNINHPDIMHDAEFPDKPRTAFGGMVAALKVRRDRGDMAFTGQCCDNLQNNGTILRQTVVGLAQLSDPELAAWIDSEASFPNSMVDCIVPATGKTELELVRSLGIADTAPVTHENFRQWVVEDDFCLGRPPWEQVGVTLTDNVHDYETMKIRILNAGHQVLANVGEILGIPTISDCMQDHQVTAFFRKVQTDEIVPYVAAVPEMSPLEYLDLIERRFANPEIHDTTRRVAFDGSSRHTGFILPILKDALAAGGTVRGMALCEAFWARMCAGHREDGSRIDPNDPCWDVLCEAANMARSDPRKWLEQSQFYGSLADADDFANAFEEWLSLIWAKGSRAALAAYLAEA